jgi:hypothetical protein
MDKNKVIYLIRSYKSTIAIFCIAITLFIFLTCRQFWSRGDNHGFSFHITGSIVYLKFSPNGQYIYAVMNPNSPYPEEHFVARVYRVQDGYIVHEVQDTAAGAWSRDGSTLAVVRTATHWAWNNGVRPTPTIQLWNTGSWTVEAELTFNRIPGGVYLNVGSICFNHNGDLFAATYDAENWDFAEELPMPWIDVPLVWWNHTPNRSKVPEKIVTDGSSEVLSISVASASVAPRMVVCYLGTQTVRICQLRHRADGFAESELSEEITLPAMVDAWVRITSDGRHIAILHKNGFNLFRIHDRRLEQIANSTSGSVYPTPSVLTADAVVVSENGQYAGCRWYDGLVEVFRVRDGNRVYHLQNVEGPIALSPEGELLAAKCGNEICFYRIPIDDDGVGSKK